MVKTKSYLKRQKKKKSPWKFFVSMGLFFSFIAGLVYFFVFARWYWITKIQIESAQELQYVNQEDIKKIVQENLEQKIFRILPQKNIIILSGAKIASEILNRFPALKSVVIAKKIPDTLVVKIEERERIGIWCQARLLKEENPVEENLEAAEGACINPEQDGQCLPEPKKENYRREAGECFLLDRDGVIFQKTSLITGSLVLNIYDLRLAQAELGQKTMPVDLLNFILDVKKELPDFRVDGGKVFSENDFTIFSAEDMRVKSSAGWQVYFNPSFSVVSQLEELKAILETEKNLLEYVDLRIKGKAYYQ